MRAENGAIYIFKKREAMNNRQCVWLKHGLLGYTFWLHVFKTYKDFGKQIYVEPVWPSGKALGW